MKEISIRKHIQNLVTAAMLMAVGIVLPFFTGCTGQQKLDT